MKKNITTFLIASIILITGCSTKQPPSNRKISLPWEDFCNKSVNNLKQKGNLAVCSCDESNSLSGIDFAKDIATAEAREKLASILEVKIGSLMEGYRNRVTEENITQEGSNFEKVFKEIVKEDLQGSYPVESKIFKTAENKYKVCSVVALNPELKNKIIKEFSKKTGINEKLLYEEFKSYKAHQRLDKELNDLR